MIVWTAINSVAIALVMLALYLTIRQVGLLLTHLGPGGARTSNLGPRVGENISSFTSELVDAASIPPQPTLYIFAAQFCPACAQVRQAAQAIARHWVSAARIVMVYDAIPTNIKNAPAGPPNWVLAEHPILREKLNVHAVPYAVMTSGNGTVVGHGLVNNASHIESLLEIKGSGVASPSEPAEKTSPQTSDNQRERTYA